MKNVILFFCFSIGFLTQLKAQNQIVTDSMPFTFQEQIATVFEHVDLTEITNGNGVLYQHGFPLYTIEPFNGILTDSSKTSMIGFSLLYATLYSMAINDVDRLPHPNTYRNICDTINKYSDVIPITLIHQELFRLSDSALADNLMTKTNNQLYDVAGRTTSPYYLHEVFMMAPAVSNISGNTLKLRVNASLVFNNTGKTIQNIEIDMADGRGYTKANIGQIATATYDSTQTVTVKFKVTYTDASIYYSHADMLITVPVMTTRSGLNIPYDSIPDYSVHLFASEPYLGSPGGGTIHVSLACGHTSIQKPFIWAEGYNASYGRLPV